VTTQKLTKEIQKQPFWALSESEVVSVLKADVKNGISEEEAKKRLNFFGQNIIESANLTLSAFQNFLRK
jgi:hypothetical protein